MTLLSPRDGRTVISYNSAEDQWFDVFDVITKGNFFRCKV